MNARYATTQDLPDLLERCEDFWLSLPYAAQVPFDRDSSRDTIQRLVRARSLYVVDDVEIVGVLGAHFQPMFMNAAALSGCELFFWVRPEYRGRGVGQALLTFAEADAGKRGCNYWSMVAVQGHGGGAAEAVYERRGYTLREKTYTKVL